MTLRDEEILALCRARDPLRADPHRGTDLTQTQAPKSGAWVFP